jgi:aspartate aminotransferase
MNDIPGVICPKPAGAFYAVAELPVDSGEKFCQWMLESFDVNGETVMMAPAAGFYSTKGVGTKQVRIAYVLNQESLKRAVNIISEGLKVYPGKLDKGSV